MKTITRVYDSYSHAQNVVDELEAAGYSSDNVSLVANKYVSDQYDDVDESSTATGVATGAALGGGAGLLAGLGVLAIPGLGPVVAAGWLASTMLGAAAGAATGGVVGALVGNDIDEPTAHVYAESVRRGGTMVTVRADDAEESRVVQIMDAHSPVDAVTRGEEYRSGGWTQFDPKAAAYQPNEAELERMRRRDL